MWDSLSEIFRVGGPFFIRERGQIVDDASSSSLIVNLTNDTCIAGMRHRIETLGGHFAMSSSPGNGTRVSIRVPRSSDATAL